MLDEIGARTGRNDALLVHSGFEPEQLQALEMGRDTGADAVLRLAFVGTIIGETAFVELIEALDAARKRSPRPILL